MFELSLNLRSTINLKLSLSSFFQMVKELQLANCINKLVSPMGNSNCLLLRTIEEGLTMETVGQILRAERERQALTIKDVEHATSIRALYLSSIEEDNYKVVPGEVYLKGFIRNYANYLGLDGTELVNMYRESQVSVAPPVEVQPAPASSKHSTNMNPVALLSPKLVATAIVLVAVVGIGFWAYGGQTKPSVPMENKAPQSVEQSQQAAQAPAIPEKPANAKPVYVQVKFNEECWTLATADGKEIYEGIPKINESFTWEAQNTLVIRAGNAGAIDVTFNGQPQGKLGTKGEVVSKTFTPTGSK
jgi:cytoskeletal protein RodZ